MESLAFCFRFTRLFRVRSDSSKLLKTQYQLKISEMMSIRCSCYLRAEIGGPGKEGSMGIIRTATQEGRRLVPPTIQQAILGRQTFQLALYSMQSSWTPILYMYEVVR